MKNFVITTNQNYNDVLKKILSDCRISGEVSPEIENFLKSLEVRHKTYDCKISGNRLTIEMPMPYRNSFASTMNLEILTDGENTRINGSISSPFSDKDARTILIAVGLIGLLVFLIIQAYRFFTATVSTIDWVLTGIAAIVFVSLPAALFKRPKDSGRVDLSDDPYAVQMNDWISNLFPGEYKVMEK